MLRSCVAVGAIVLLCSMVSPSEANPTIRVSTGPAGQQADAPSRVSDISADGRWVAFSSSATNVGARNAGRNEQVYLRDLRLGQTVLVSVGTNGRGGNNGSFDAAVSGNGRFVCFPSFASNLVPNDSNGHTDIFLRDVQRGTTERVNVNNRGREARGPTFGCDISADGRRIVFDSQAGKLVPQDTNGAFDIFLRDRVAGTTARVSLGLNGAQTAGGYSIRPRLSDDGRFLTFQSAARNLVEEPIGGGANIYVRDLKTGRNTLVSRGMKGKAIDLGASWPAISGDGRFVAFDASSSNLVPGDSNGAEDVFVFDRQTERVERVSVASDGTQANDASINPEISGDGRLVLFTSFASNLVPSDSNRTYDVFVHDRETGRTQRVSIGSRRQQGNGSSEVHLAIAHDGRFAVFTSDADNLVGGDTNGVADVFLRSTRSLAEQPGR